MEKKLYEVSWVRQDTGEFAKQYVFAENMAVVEQEYADIVSVHPCEFIELPEKLTP